MSEIANLAPKIKERATSGRLGRNVRYIMDERGISQAELARRLGLSESQVSRRIGGGVKWTPADIEDTADALGVDIGLLFKLKLPPIAPGGGTTLYGVGSSIKRQIAGMNRQPSDYKAADSRPVALLADHRARRTPASA